MPQTSPINWVILSLCMNLSILYTMSLINEKMNHKTNKKTNLIYMTMKSWNW